MFLQEKPWYSWGDRKDALRFITDSCRIETAEPADLVWKWGENRSAWIPGGRSSFSLGYLLLNCLINLAGGYWINSWSFNKGHWNCYRFPMDFGFPEDFFLGLDFRIRFVSGLIRSVFRIRMLVFQDRIGFFG